MLFTNFLRTKGKQNRQPQTNCPVVQQEAKESRVLKPTVSGYISNTKQSHVDKTSHIGSTIELTTNDQTESGRSNLAETMLRLRLDKTANLTLSPRQCTQYDDEKQYWNPLHRIGTRKQQAKERSRSYSRSQSRIIIGRSDTSATSTNSRIKQTHDKSVTLDDMGKLCINCDNFIPSSIVATHERECAGFEKILAMNKQELFMFVHGKIARDQVRLEEVRKNAQQGIVIGNPHVLTAQLECRIDYLHKVRNGIMTRLS